MTSKERVMAALRLEEPDRVPHGEGLIDPGLYEKLIGEVSDIKVDVAPSDIRTSRGKELAESQKKLAEVFELDIINYPMLAPVFVGQTLEFVLNTIWKWCSRLRLLSIELCLDSHDSSAVQARKLQDCRWQGIFLRLTQVSRPHDNKNVRISARITLHCTALKLSLPNQMAGRRLLAKSNNRAASEVDKSSETSLAET